MADADILQNVGGELVSRIFGSILYFGLAFLIIGVLGGFMYYQFIYRKRFDIDVKLISNRANNNNSIILDKAAILYEPKTTIPYFRIWGLKRDFPVPKYDVLQKTNKGDYLEIYRDSEESFYFLTPSQIYKTQVIQGNGQLVNLSDQKQVMVDPEMGFWAVKRKSTNKKMFDTESLIMKILPYVPQIVGGVIVIFILYILMDALPSILGEVKDLAIVLKKQQTTQAAVVSSG